MVVARASAVTDPGRKRRRNEDAFVCEPPLFAIADGMGGAQAGEVASELAASVLRESHGGGGGKHRVESLIQEANRRVYARSSEDAAVSGMGTTMTVALVDDGLIWIGHVGDSRAYLIRDGRLDQLTEDHSLVAELVRTGKLSPEEADTHPQRSVITRAVGTDPDVDVDTFPVEPEAGDVFLICSDGLTDMVDEETILGIVEHRRDDLDALVRALVSAANRSGGEDNITVVAFEVADGDEPLEDTRTYPAGLGTEEDENIEDTLSGLEAPPAVDTMVVPAEQIREHIAEAERREAASAPESPARAEPIALAPELRRLLLALAVVAALALAFALVVVLVGKLL